MDCNTGEISRIHGDTDAELESKMDELRSAFELENNRKLLPLTEGQAEELMPLSKKGRKNNMRNKPCVCGSGIKFKRCCWGEYA